MSDVETADTGTKVRSVPCERPVGLSCDLAHRSGRTAAYRCRPSAPHRSALIERMLTRSVCAGRARRNRAIRPTARALPAGRVNRSRYPSRSASSTSAKSPRSIASVPTLICARSAFSLRLSSRPALLKDAQGIADSFAGILVFAVFDDLLNKRILLGCQADVPGRHLGPAVAQDTMYGKDCQSV